MLTDLGFEPGGIPGPEFWLLPNGNTLFQEACAIEDGNRAEVDVAETPAVADPAPVAVAADASAATDGDGQANV